MPFAPKLPPLKPAAARPPRGTTEQRGYGTAHRKQRARLIDAHPLCQRCANDWSAHLHHIDRDPFNRDPSNVEMLCTGCHDREHGRG